MAEGEQLQLKLLFILLIITCLTPHSYSVYVKNITATNTCGSPAEQYFASWQVDFQPIDRIPSVCNASDPKQSHPIINTIDGNHSTFWQSIAGHDSTEIIVDLQTVSQKVLFVNSISLKFGSSQRPGQIEYLRSCDGGILFFPWHYFVSLAFECESIFKTSFIQRPFDVDTVVCRMFDEVHPKSGNETVFVDLSGGRGNDIRLQNWLNVSHIKIKFSGLHRPFDRFSHRWHHYNVREINISATCYCNGHASTCKKDDSDYVCLCDNNACGTQCQVCCPKFNQKKWRKGKKNPFEVDVFSQCEECNCHNHSNVCIYNQTVADRRLSVDMLGNYTGGGVCQDCLHNTTGINCQQCKEFFYHPRNKSLFDIYACQSCSCNEAGVRHVVGVKFLDCARDDNINAEPGDCFCKKNVDGKDCHKCKPGFFNLTETNPNGCQDCECFIIGTRNADITCMPSDGRCSCKQFTTGQQCNVCLDGYYNLTASNDNGCTDCHCNLGASKSYVCDKENGICHCHVDNIYGDKCEFIKDGFYYPSVHFIRDDNLIRTNKIVMGWMGQIMIPNTVHSKNEFYFIFVCNCSVDVIGFVSARNSTTTLNGGFISVKKHCVNCYIATQRNFTLYPGYWSIEILFLSITTNGIVSCNSIIGVPSEFYALKSLQNGNEFQKYCDVTTNNMTHSICQHAAYTLTMNYLHAPLSCDCNKVGSFNSSCEKYKGQCYCKPGVSGKLCDRCDKSFYNFTNDGCTMCNCFGMNVVCDAVTGQCLCPPNTKGRTCSTCERNHWNLTKRAGCEPCNCSSLGATSGDCNVKTGQCECKLGVEGQQCSTCVDGYTEFSGNGCRTCNCSNIGSLSSVCNKDNGQCFCKNLTMGQYCDKCAAGSFYLSRENQNGCLPCLCMGATKNCTKARGYFSLKESLITDWGMGTEDGLLMNVFLYNETRSFPNSPMLMLSAPIVSQKKPLFWISITDFFSGSAVSIYGGSIAFYLEVEVAPKHDFQLVLQKVILKNSVVDMIAQSFHSVPMNQITRRSVQLKESMWRSVKTNDEITRLEFLNFLSRPIQLFISASPMAQSTFGYTVRLGSISFTVYKENITTTDFSAIEKCYCPIGYEGYSCETCVDGFFRSNDTTQIYIGSCIPCQCSNHADYCDKTSGMCFDCDHNTAGHHCEMCKPGFYGNATVGYTSDCQPCPCELPSATSSVCYQDKNQLVTCSNCSIGYEGRLCEKCSLGFYRSGIHCVSCRCSNNSFMCNKTTGVCYNCTNNTTSDHCDVCQDGWYGNATLQQCKECGCSEDGSFSNVCNMHGDCTCLPNVFGKKCSQCAPNTYGLNNITGCTPCECNTLGSQSLQCDLTGQCLCLNNSTGKKCDQCTHGLWGLPLKECSDCYCNATGSINQSCSAVFGQCSCKIGVGTRQCDTCLTQHTNFSSNGCDVCPNCTRLLQSKIDKLSVKVVNLRNSSADITLLLQTNEGLTNVTNLLHRSQILEARFNHRLNSLRKNINKFTSQLLQDSIGSLKNQTLQLLTNMSLHANISQMKINCLNMIKSNASRALNLVLETNASVSATKTMLSSYNVQTLKWTTIIPSLVNWTKEIELEVSQHVNNITAANNAIADLLQNVTLSFNMAVQQFSNVSNMTTVYQSFMVQHSKNNDAFVNWKTVQNEVKQNYTNVVNIYKDIEKLLLQNNASIFESSSVFLYVTEDVSQINDSLKAAKQTHQKLNHSVCCGDESLVMRMRSLNQSLNEQFDGFPQQVINATLVKAETMKSSAKNISRLFADARKHGEKAFLSIELYQSIFTIVNRSKEITAVTNETLHDVMRLLSNYDGHNLSMIAYNSSVDGQLLLNDVESGFQFLHGLSKNMSALNSSLNNASRIWKEIHVLHTGVVNMTMKNDVKLRTLHVGINSLRNSTDELTALMSAVKNVGDISSNITRMEVKLSQCNVSVINNSLSYHDAKTKVSIIDIKLNDSTSIIGNIDQSIRIMQHFNATKDSLELRLMRLRKKLAELKQAVMKVNIPVQINNRSMHKTVDIVSSADSMEIQMEFKTKNKNGILLELREISKKNIWVRISILNSHLVVDYSTLYGNHSVVNWAVDASNGVWKRVLFSRLNTSSRLTMTSDDLTRTYGQFSVYNLASLKPSASTQMDLSIGGMNSTWRSSFNGCVGNLKVNGQQVSLVSLNLSSNVSQHGVCDGMRTRHIHLKTPGASFYGSGYIMQDIGNFSILGNYKIQFEFRSLRKNGTLFAVQDGGEHIPLSIQLSEGHLVTLLSPDVSSASMVLRSVAVVANGDWYRVNVKNIYDNITMSIMNSSMLVESITFPLVGTVSKEGVYVYLGGLNDTSLMRAHFAGCMKSLYLSHGDTMTMRSFDGRVLNGVHFNGCLLEVEKGVHFFDGGFSVLQTTLPLLFGIEFTFKTKVASGVILSHFDENMLLYITLFHGNIYVRLNDSNVYSTDQTLNDGTYHTVTISLNDTSLRLDIDDGRVTAASRISATVFSLYGQTFIAGANTSMGTALPVWSGFVGDFSDFLFNNISILDDLVRNSKLVSMDEVSVSPTVVPVTDLPTMPPTTLTPPTCAPHVAPLEYSSQLEWVGFSGNSLLALEPAEKDRLMSYFMINFVVTIEFRSILPNGVIFYASNNNETNFQYICLELVDGKLTYQFDAGVGVVKMKTDLKYNTGKWFKVYMIRISQFGAILISETQEYHNAENGNTFRRMVLTSPIYLGGTPVGANTSMLSTPYGKSFWGCIRTFELAESHRTFAFNLRYHQLTNATRNLRKCYTKVRPQVSFHSNGYALINGNTSVSPYFQLVLQLRSATYSGLLWHVSNGTRDLYLKQHMGKLELSYEDQSSTTILLSWSGSNWWRNISFSLCDGATKKIKVDRVGSFFRLFVDEVMTIAKRAFDIDMQGSLYIGGSPLLDVSGFIGCIQEAEVNSEIIDFSHSMNVKNMTVGCQSSNR